MPSVRTTPAFDAWIDGLRDRTGRAHILRRIVRLSQHGHFGDVAPVGERVSELRIHVGPGYRVYFVERDDGAVVVLLGGGDKGTQARDIVRAKSLAATV